MVIDRCERDEMKRSQSIFAEGRKKIWSNTCNCQTVRRSVGRGEDAGSRWGRAHAGET